MNETLSCREAFTSTLLDLAKKDPSIIVLTSDAKGSSSLGPFAQELSEQFLEIGIAEQNEVGVAAGLACVGRRPFICAPASFLSARSLEQVKVDVAYSHNNVKLFGVSGGISYGPLGATHHSLHDIAVMRAFPDLEIFIPSDPVQTQALAKYLAASGAPAYVRVGKAALPALYDSEEAAFSPGKANMLRDGRDLTLIACGEPIFQCMKAAEGLERGGISVRVLDMHTLKPLDESAILSAAKETGLIITAEEHSIYGGLGAAVAQVTAASCPVTVKSLGIPDEYAVSGTTAQVFHYYGLDAEGICRTAKTCLQNQKSKEETL